MTQGVTRALALQNRIQHEDTYATLSGPMVAVQLEWHQPASQDCFRYASGGLELVQYCVSGASANCTQGGLKPHTRVPLIYQHGQGTYPQLRSGQRLRQANKPAWLLAAPGHECHPTWA
jgi:hypothetical protein